ncbi:hypothetical protein CKK34_5603 [Yarrowia sp. E02]|nr:hypothetical protein CKK34_5603 [Yarrowia sp. E02]
MSRRKSAKAESPAVSETALRGPLSQPNNQAFLTRLRNMPEFAQTFQMVHLFKRALQVAEPVEIEVLEEELITCDMGRLTRQITWALIRAHMRIKKKQVDDVELWNLAKRVWEGHRDEWEEEQERLSEKHETKEEEEDHVTEVTHVTARDSRKRSPSPAVSPVPQKRTRSTRSRAKEEAKEEEEKSRDKSRVKKEDPVTPEIDLEELASFSRDLELRNMNRKLILPDFDFNPFSDSPTLVSSFGRFSAFQLVQIWYQLIQWIFDHEDKARELVETTLRLTDYKPEELRSEPLGNDSENCVFYLFGDSRLYKREERLNSSGFDVLDLDIDTWSCVCATWEDWETFMASLEARDTEYKRLSKQQSKLKGKKKSLAVIDESLQYDSELYAFFSKDVLPVVSEVFVEKARASVSRDKERLLEAAMATRKTSSRIQALQAKKEEQDKLDRKEAESRAAQKQERKRLERIELQRKQMEERQQARERRFERRNGARNEGTLTNPETAEETESRERRRPPRRAAAVAAVTWMFDCICGLHGENYEDDKAMIECETCKTWMHIECLRDRRNVDTESFECDVCGTREEREARARERERVEEEKAEKRRKVEEERLKVEEEKARLKKEKNAQRWQERKRRMKEKREAEEAESREAESRALARGSDSRDGADSRDMSHDMSRGNDSFSESFSESHANSFSDQKSPVDSPRHPQTLPQQQQHAQPFSHFPGQFQQGQFPQFGQFQQYHPAQGHPGQVQGHPGQGHPAPFPPFNGMPPIGQFHQGPPVPGQVPGQPGQVQFGQPHLMSPGHLNGPGHGPHVTGQNMIHSPISPVNHHTPVTHSPVTAPPLASPGHVTGHVNTPTNGHGHVSENTNGV